MTVKFDFPLSPSDRASAVTLLLATEDGIEIDGCGLFPDRKLDVIWATDAYGQDTIASSKADLAGVHEALEWINSMHRQSAEFKHPAEGGLGQQHRKCRICGCTEMHACEGGCWWIEFDLCSACRNRASKGD